MCRGKRRGEPVCGFEEADQRHEEERRQEKQRSFFHVPERRTPARESHAGRLHQRERFSRRASPACRRRDHRRRGRVKFLRSGNHRHRQFSSSAVIPELAQINPLPCTEVRLAVAQRDAH